MCQTELLIRLRDPDEQDLAPLCPAEDNRVVACFAVEP